MLFFILWVVLILSVILAIPIASMLDKRKHQAMVASAIGDVDGEEMISSADEEFVAEAEIAEAPEVVDEFAESAEPIDDDFSAFEEEFK